MAIKDDLDRLRTFCDGPFAELCTPAEMADELGIDESTIRYAIRAGRLEIGRDCIKMGKQWVLSRTAWLKMTGTYGELSRIKTDYQKWLRADMGLG